MRVARVIGKVTLNRQLPDILPGSYLVVRTCGRSAMAGKGADNDETLVLYDCLSAGENDLVGIVEGREAAAPFWPRKVPFDCYTGCVLDSVNFDPILEVE